MPEVREQAKDPIAEIAEEAFEELKQGGQPAGRAEKGKGTMLPTRKTPPKVSLSDQTVLVHGRPKIGKSALCAGAPVVFTTDEDPGKPDAYVFPNAAGRPWRNNLLTRLRACCKKARISLDGVDLHALRATFATLVMETGADLKTAQTLIGHGGASGVLLLDKYAKPRILRLRETAAAVEELVFGAEPGQAAQPAVPIRRVG